MSISTAFRAFPRGRARILRTLAEGIQFKKGEILVAQSPAPTWGAPLTIAGGLATDTGGPLAHCAVVARECGIPAVVGTINGTRLSGTASCSRWMAPPAR